MLVFFVQYLQLPLLFKEAEKHLAIMQDSEKADHTRLSGTISLKLSSSCRRSSTYGGSGVIYLGSSSITIPLVSNMEREGTTIFLRYAAANEDVLEASALIMFAQQLTTVILSDLSHRVCKPVSENHL